MSYTYPHVVDDDDDAESDGGNSIIELLGYGELRHRYLCSQPLPTSADSDSEPEIIAVNNVPALARPSNRTIIRLPDTGLQQYRLQGIHIRAGDTVELRDHSNQPPNAMHSGDFLHVKHIIMNMDTEQVRLRGHRMRRTKYLGQIFECG